VVIVSIRGPVPLRFTAGLWLLIEKVDCASILEDLQAVSGLDLKHGIAVFHFVIFVREHHPVKAVVGNQAMDGNTPTKNLPLDEIDAQVLSFRSWASCFRATISSFLHARSYQPEP
jgi:hypothetical protein